MTARRRLPGRSPLLACAALLLVASVPAATYVAPASLTQWTARANDASAKLGEKWTVYVEDLATSETVFAYNADKKVAPASNRKIVTAALALDLLGPTHQFTTEFGLDGATSTTQGTWNGNLIVRSAGDPTMGGPTLKSPSNPAELLDNWAKALRARGISKVAGDLILDASAFGRSQGAYPDDVWEPHHRSYAYAAIPSAITFNENVLRVTVRHGAREGAAGIVSVFPTAAGMRLDNEVRTSARRGGGVSVDFTDDLTTLKVTGRIGRTAEQEVAVVPLTRPLETFAAAMLQSLEKSGVELDGSPKLILERLGGAEPAQIAVPVARNESPPLNRILPPMLLQSDNFVAEQIWLAAAARAGGVGDRLTARKVEQNWLSGIGLAWIEPGWDGCGLSRRTLFSARELTLISRYVYRSVWRDILLGALPVSGRSGTLRGRDFSASAGRVIAKTGTLSGVSGLTGFILDKNKRPRLVFSAMANAPGNTDGRLAMRINELVKLLIQDLDAGRL